MGGRKKKVERSAKGELAGPRRPGVRGTSPVGREGNSPQRSRRTQREWIPAFAGMTVGTRRAEEDSPQRTWRVWENLETVSRLCVLAEHCPSTGSGRTYCSLSVCVGKVLLSSFLACVRHFGSLCVIGGVSVRVTSSPQPPYRVRGRLSPANESGGCAGGCGRCVSCRCGG